MAQFASCADLQTLSDRIEECCANAGGGTTEVADQTSITGVGTTTDPFKVDLTWLGQQISSLETVTALQTFSFDTTTNVLTIQYLDENNAVTTKTVDLSSLASVEVADQTSITGVGTTTDPFKVNETWLSEKVREYESDTTLQSVSFDPTTNILTVQYVGEDNVVQIRTTDLSALANPAVVPLIGVNANKAGSSQVFPNNAVTPITGWTNLSDTTAGAWNPTTGVFTASRAGWYTASASILLAAANWTAGGQASISIWKNGVILGQHLISTTVGLAGAIKDTMSYQTTVYLNAGDTLDARLYNLTGGAATNHPQVSHTTFSLVEIGA